MKVAAALKSDQMRNKKILYRKMIPLILTVFINLCVVFEWYRVTNDTIIPFITILLSVISV